MPHVFNFISLKTTQAIREFCSVVLPRQHQDRNEYGETNQQECVIIH